MCTRELDPTDSDNSTHTIRSRVVVVVIVIVVKIARELCDFCAVPSRVTIVAPQQSPQQPPQQQPPQQPQSWRFTREPDGEPRPIQRCTASRRRRLHQKTRFCDVKSQPSTATPPRGRAEMSGRSTCLSNLHGSRLQSTSVLVIMTISTLLMSTTTRNVDAATRSVSIPLEMEEKLNAGRRVYDKQSTPTSAQGWCWDILDKKFWILGLPTTVNLSMYIEGISSFRTQTMDFQVCQFDLVLIKPCVFSLMSIFNRLKPHQSLSSCLDFSIGKTIDSLTTRASMLMGL